MLESGAVADAESKIGALAEEALEAARSLPVPAECVEDLVDLTEQLVWRTS
jgi:hypothetical protein